MAQSLIPRLRNGFLCIFRRRSGTAQSPPAPAPRAGAFEQPCGEVCFRLWAPFKQGVFVAGTWNGWAKDRDRLVAGADGTWSLTRRLERGRHEYMFVVDGDTWIGDPYAREVAWNATGANAVLHVGRPPFLWSDNGFQLPDLRDQVLYEVNVGEFSPEGAFAGVTARLPHVKSLGVRGIELMPVLEFPGDVSLGYNPAHFLAPEKRYGSPDDLKRLVDEAHQLGLAVLLDVVFNHAAPEHPFARLYPHHESPWFSGQNPWGMPDFDHGKPATRSFVDEMQGFWLHEYHLDGFRYDATRWIEGNAESGFGHLSWQASETKPWIYRIAEHIPEDPDILRWTRLDACWHDTFSATVNANLREDVAAGWGDLDALMSVLDPHRRGYAGPRQVINYLESHDHERVVAEVMRNQWLGGHPEVVRAKEQLGLVTLAVAAGVPMLYAGQELAMKERTTYAGVRPVDWSRLDTDEGRARVGFLQRVLWFRNTHPALRSDNVDFPWVSRDQKTLAVHRWNDHGDDVVALLNFSNDPQSVHLSFPQAGPWHEYLHGGVVSGPGREASVVVPRSGALLFATWKNW